MVKILHDFVGSFKPHLLYKIFWIFRFYHFYWFYQGPLLAWSFKKSWFCLCAHHFHLCFWRSSKLGRVGICCPRPLKIKIVKSFFRVETLWHYLILFWIFIVHLCFNKTYFVILWLTYFTSSFSSTEFLKSYILFY